MADNALTLLHEGKTTHKVNYIKLTYFSKLFIFSVRLGKELFLTCKKTTTGMAFYYLGSGH
jgi:hypothetical protein